jgi:hypothetical protein
MNVYCVIWPPRYIKEGAFGVAGEKDVEETKEVKEGSVDSEVRTGGQEGAETRVAEPVGTGVEGQQQSG